MAISRRGFLAASMAGVALSAYGQSKLRVGIIGDTNAGGYGHDLHKIWLGCSDIDVVAVADPDEAGRAKHIAESGALRGYAEYREMLEKEKPDIVTIGPRWTERHRDYMLACIEAGAHGMTEKPLASDLVEADAMVAAAEARGLKWSIAFNWRAAPIVAHARKCVVEDGIIGDVLEVRTRGKEDHRSGAEDMVVLGTHLFDMMRFFAGDPRWCGASIECDNRPATLADVHAATEPIGPIVGDTIHAEFGFDAGLRGYFASTKRAGGNANRWGMDLMGTKGIMIFRLQGDGIPAVRVLLDPSWSPGISGAAWEPLPDAPVAGDPIKERFTPIVDDLVSAIREDRRPKVSIQDGQASLEMIMAVYAAHLAGGRVALPLEKRTHPLG